MPFLAPLAFLGNDHCVHATFFKSIRFTVKKNTNNLFGEMSAPRSAALLAVVAALALTTAVAHAQDFSPLFPPTNSIGRCNASGIANDTMYYGDLLRSRQMPAQVGAARVGVPFAILVSFFDQAQNWPSWNSLFLSNGVTSYNLCDPFNAVAYSNAPRVFPPFPSNMTAPHFIDQHGFSDDGNTFAFGWIFQLLGDGTPSSLIVYGRHTFTLRRYVDESGTDSTLVESFEKVAGPQLDTQINRVAWTVAIQESLIDGVKGFSCLERVYVATGGLSLSAVQVTCDPFTP